MPRTKVGPSARRKNAATKTKTEPKPLTLGVNVPVYLKQRKYTKKQIGPIMKAAEIMARERGSRIVRLEFVMLADGTITERDLGSPKIEQMRRSIMRQRLGLGEKSGRAAVETRTPAPARPRKQRAKAPTSDD